MSFVFPELHHWTPQEARKCGGRTLSAKKGVIIVKGLRLVCAKCQNDVFLYHLMTFTPGVKMESFLEGAMFIKDDERYVGGGFIQCQKCGALYKAPEKYDEIVSA